MLRSGVVGDPPSLEGHLFAGNNFETVNLVFDQLTNYDASSVPQPMLAESWDVGTDYKQIKLNLRKGVQWHTGREFTSDDVKCNILRAPGSEGRRWTVRQPGAIGSPASTRPTSTPPS